VAEQLAFVMVFFWHPQFESDARCRRYSHFSPRFFLITSPETPRKNLSRRGQRVSERAIAELKLARELDPLSLPVNSTLGRMYRDTHRYSEAIQQCRKTIELDPNFSMGHWCLAQAYAGQRQYSAAIPGVGTC
jgi:cytochrome c-type biogenesis protein CcmH/NrfG